MDIVESIQRTMRTLSRLGIHHGYHAYESGRVDFFGPTALTVVREDTGRVEAAFPGFQVVSGPETAVLLPEGAEQPESLIDPQGPTQPDYRVSEDKRGSVTFEIEGHEPIRLTPRMLDLFKAYADDAPHWDYTPWASVGNVALSKADRGVLTNLAKVEVIRLEDYDGDKVVHFTATGVIVAAHYGFTVEEI